ncbi:MAG: hypothetical protein IPI49_19820 [Myxococcales bacterium]|nr:hypothetical protein [Myxococcales bacterium]
MLVEQHDLLKVIQPALAPILPLLQIVDAVLATFRCLQAVPAALGPPPDPSVLTTRLSELAKKADKLLRLMPQLSVPLTVAGVLDLLVAELGNAERQLQGLVRQTQRAAEAAEHARGLGDEGLLRVVACVRGNVAQEVENIGVGLSALSQLVALLNLLGGLVGAPRVPDLSHAAGLSLSDMLGVVASVRDVLSGVRATLPRDR